MTRSSAIRGAGLALGLVIAGATASFARAAGQDFIKGVDISTFQALEDSGVKFYDGGKQGDLLAILKAHGVNYVRLRVWNTPTESGGYNDRKKLLLLAPRVKAAGLKLLVDFHYSDFWADPGKQVKPAAWDQLNEPQLQKAVYDYTRDELSGLKAVNAYPDMVQIGNEINSGMLLPDGSVSDFAGLAGLLKQGVRAVRDTTPKGSGTKIMLHLANGGDNAEFVRFFDQIRAQGIDYDVIGLSYYPYWHGPFPALRANMNDLAARYGKEIVVAETAYPYTLADGDNSGGNIAGPERTQKGGLPATVANQMLVTQTVMNTVAQVPGGKGLGVFYWEPAWIPGVGWKTGEANGWENQAMFDFKGNALASLDAFRFTPGSLGEATPILASPAPDVTVARGNTPTLPTQVNVVQNDSSSVPMPVRWQALTPTQLSTPGQYTLQGMVAGTKLAATVTVTVAAQVNLVQNPGFEDDLNHWTLTGAPAGKIDSKAGNPHAGSKIFNYWSGPPYAYALTQKITGLKNGVYTLKAWASGLGGENKAALLAQGYGGPDLSASVKNTGWNVWKQYAVEHIHVTNGKITIGYGVDSPKEVWGFLDDVELSQVSAD